MIAWLFVLLALVYQPQPPEPAGCVAVIGDSIAYGEATFQIPGQGFITTRTASLADALAPLFDDVVVHDRTAPASYLNWFSEATYFQSDAYAALLDDGCDLNIIAPWYNDFSLLERGGGPAEYIPWLGYLIYSVKAQNPDARFILLDFFPVAPADFMNTVYAYVTPQYIDLYNQALALACLPDGPLGRIDGVTCAPTAGVFDDLDGAHLITDVNRQTFETWQTEPLDETAQTILDFYWEQNPDGQIQGDGVHLTPLGQQTFAEFITLVAQPG